MIRSHGSINRKTRCVRWKSRRMIRTTVPHEGRQCFSSWSSPSITTTASRLAAKRFGERRQQRNRGVRVLSLHRARSARTRNRGQAPEASMRPSEKWYEFRASGKFRRCHASSVGQDHQENNITVINVHGLGDAVLGTLAVSDDQVRASSGPITRPFSTASIRSRNRRTRNSASKASHLPEYIFPEIPHRVVAGVDAVHHAAPDHRGRTGW